MAFSLRVFVVCSLRRPVGSGQPMLSPAPERLLFRVCPMPRPERLVSALRFRVVLGP